MNARSLSLVSAVSRTFSARRALPAAAAFAMLGAGLPAQAERVVLPTGTVLPVRLDGSLSSRTALRGDRFTAGIQRGGGDNGLPRGARVRGVVRRAVPARGDRPGMLDVEFTRLVFPGGRSESIEGSLIALDSRSVRVTRGGRLVAADARERDRMTFVGAGAGAGLIIGSIARHSAIESILLGAAAGLLANEMRRAPAGDVTLRHGAEFGVRLDRPVAFHTDGRERAWRDEDERWRDDDGRWRDRDRDDDYDSRRPIGLYPTDSRYDRDDDWRGRRADGEWGARSRTGVRETGVESHQRDESGWPPRSGSSPVR